MLLIRTIKGHFGCAGLKSQLRAHFHFPLLDTLEENEVKHCRNCNLYTSKAIKDPLVPVYVPSKAWEYVSIDFFCPLPQGEHVLVIQDLCTKYPAAVLIERNTSAKVTIEAIDKFFTNFGQPTRYRSDKVVQWVYVKSKRRTKFQPVFLTDPWIIESVTKTGATVHNRQISKRKIRHVDDIKPHFPQKTAVNLPGMHNSLMEETFELPQNNQPDIQQQNIEHLPQPSVNDNIIEQRPPRNRTSTFDIKCKEFPRI